jgi:tetratricopeptide (TPR) repeat protein
VVFAVGECKGIFSLFSSICQLITEVIVRLVLLLSCLVTFAAPVEAGLHYSGEIVAELPAAWRGFLLDQRALRMVAVAPTPVFPPSPLRTQYENAVLNLELVTKKRELTADELADVGALHLRLGQTPKALDVLLPASRRFPEHFRIMSNLGTTWQMQGDLDRASDYLSEAVRLAPPKLREAEE